MCITNSTAKLAVVIHVTVAWASDVYVLKTTVEGLAT